MLLQLVDAARDVVDAVLQDLLGDLFLIEDDNLLDRAYARASNLRQWPGFGVSQWASVKAPSARF
jgi:hypothetical protein